ncbi:MAG: 30S ribosomal protein S13 [Candidatus Njordarchaeales archaeon]
MARISGVNIPTDKKIKVSLTYIFGIGSKMSQNILETTNIDPEKRVKDLTEDEIEKIRKNINLKHRVEGDLHSEVTQNVRRLKDISAYRGLRHKKGLPVRGQRTKTNARTKRGKKVTVGSGRKKADQKT